MEYLIPLAGFIVSVFTILAYIKSTFKGSVDLIVQPTFKSINDTLKTVDRTMAKLNIMVDTVVEKQHQFDKDLMLLQKDVATLSTIANEVAQQQHTIDTDFALMNQNLVSIHARQNEFEEKIKALEESFRR